KPAAVPKTTASAAQEVSEEGVERDLSKVPSEIERKMEELDVDGALRPTILKAGTPWSKREQKALLAAASERSLGTDEQKTERQRVATYSPMLIDHSYVNAIALLIFCDVDVW